MVSESDDMSTHLQVDATPTVAAKTLRRTRKKNGSQIDLSVVSYLAHFSLKTPQRVIDEQCKLRSDAAEYDIWSRFVCFKYWNFYKT